MLTYRVMPITPGGEAGESLQQASLRPLIETIDREMATLAGGTAIESRAAICEVQRAWAHLVEIMGLGPAPEMRACPACRHMGMRAATRCGFCWTALSSLADGGAPAHRETM